MKNGLANGATRALRGPLRFAALLLPTLLAATASAQTLHEKIDAAINAKAGGAVAPAASDAEFLRRAHLDLIGLIPTADEARKFFADADPAKRAKLIDALLARPEYGRRMQAALTAMLLERRTDTVVPEVDWEKYLTDSFNANKPWHTLVRELLFADDDPQLAPAKKFFAVSGRQSNPNQMAQDVSRILLGRDMMCAQCHDHPTVADFKQADFYGLFSYLQESAEQAKSDFESVFVPGKKSTFPRLPGGAEVMIPTIAKEQTEELKAWRPRLLLARDLPTPANVLFQRNSVNRLWYLMMGRGLVHPLDMHHADNPPSHPELLELLAADFAAHQFDVKYLLREIALSQAYQRSSLLPEGVAEADAPPQSYRVANFKPLSPELMAWNVMQASGNLAAMLAAPAPEKSTFTYNDYLNGRIQQPPTNLRDAMTLFIGVFGNPPGEPEVEVNPAMGHALFLMNEALVLRWLQPAGGNLVERLSGMTDNAALADELYLSVLTRTASDEEKAEVASYLEKFASRRPQALGDLVWALVCSAEFRANH
jgi:hypothetical protein